MFDATEYEQAIETAKRKAHLSDRLQALENVKSRAQIALSDRDTAKYMGANRLANRIGFGGIGLSVVFGVAVGVIGASVEAAVFVALGGTLVSSFCAAVCQNSQGIKNKMTAIYEEKHLEEISGLRQIIRKTEGEKEELIDAFRALPVTEKASEPKLEQLMQKYPEIQTVIIQALQETAPLTTAQNTPVQERDGFNGPA